MLKMKLDHSCLCGGKHFFVTYENGIDRYICVVCYKIWDLSKLKERSIEAAQLVRRDTPNGKPVHSPRLKSSRFRPETPS